MDKFLETIKKYSLIKKGDRILAGVSGGPDSVALILKLVEIAPRFDLTLFIAHLDHGVRKNSVADAVFVQKLGQKLAIPVITRRLNSPAKTRGSLEEYLRQERLGFLIQAAKKVKADKIALGHNLDDQAETVLMRVLRGTGLAGLSAILPKKNLNGKEFIRPLLETPRGSIEQYLKKRKVKARIDPTNKDEIFMRNKIRRQLLPLLKAEYNPNIAEVLSGLAQSAAQDYDYLEKQARELCGSRRRLDLKKCRRMHPAILRMKLRLAIAAQQGNTRRIGLQHIKELEELIFIRPVGSVVDLPKELSAQKTARSLIFYRR